MDIALTRLRDPSSPALAKLARLMVADLTRTPIREIVHPKWLASQIVTAIEATSRGDLLRSFVATRIDAGLEQASKLETRGRDYLPVEVDEPLRALLRHPWTPDVDITLRVLDQPAMRTLVAEVLTTMLTRFRKRMSSLDGGILKGFGGRAARRSRGLFGGVADLADSVVGAVKEEVEHGLDEKVREFVDGATRDALRGIAEHVADPAHSEAFAGLRVGVLDVLLDTPVQEIVAEIEKGQPVEILDVLLLSMQQMARSEDFVDRVANRMSQVMEEVGSGTLEAWLDEVELKDIWMDTTTEWIGQRLETLVQTDAFADWWTDLFLEE